MIVNSLHKKSTQQQQNTTHTIERALILIEMIKNGGFFIFMEIVPRNEREIVYEAMGSRIV